MSPQERRRGPAGDGRAGTGGRQPGGPRKSGSASKGGSASKDGRAGGSSRGASTGRGAQAGRPQSGRDGAPGAGTGAGGRRGSRAAARDGAEGAAAGETVEGRQAVAELLRARRRHVHHVTIADSTERSGLLDEILRLADEAGVPVRRVGRERLAGLAGTEVPQGVVATAEPLPDVSLDGLLATRGPADPFLVVLDGVTDPHNVGAVMRSALSAGATGMVMARHRSAHLGPAAVKAAAGAVEWLPVAVVPGVGAALAELRRAGVWTIGLDADGDTEVWDLQVATEPVALVLGSEGRGLSALGRQRCDVVASVPMLGPLASLNVSAAAALACFEVARRRRAAARPA